MAETDVKTETATDDKAAGAEGNGKAAETKQTQQAPKAKSFEELLAEFSGSDDDEDDPKPVKKAAKRKSDDEDEDEDDSLVSKAKRLRERASERDPEVEELLEMQRRQDFTKDVKKAGGEDLADIDDELIMALALSKLSPSLNTAFAKRKANPKDWSAAKKILAAGVVEMLGKFNKAAKAAEGEDDEEEPRGEKNSAKTQAAARAAARATETRKSPDSAMREEDQKMMSLSNSEFISELRKKGINLGL